MRKTLSTALLFLALPLVSQAMERETNHEGAPAESRSKTKKRGSSGKGMYQLDNLGIPTGMLTEHTDNPISIDDIINNIGMLLACKSKEIEVVKKSFKTLGSLTETLLETLKKPRDPHNKDWMETVARSMHEEIIILYHAARDGRKNPHIPANEREVLNIIEQDAYQSLAAATHIAMGGLSTSTFYWLYNINAAEIVQNAPTLYQAFRHPRSGVEISIFAAVFKVIQPLLAPLCIFLAGTFAWHKVKQYIRKGFESELQREFKNARENAITAMTAVEQLKKETKECVQNFQTILAQINRNAELLSKLQDAQSTLAQDHDSLAAAIGQLEEEQKKIAGKQQQFREDFEKLEFLFKYRFTETERDLAVLSDTTTQLGINVHAALPKIAAMLHQVRAIAAGAGINLDGAPVEEPPVDTQPQEIPAGLERKASFTERLFGRRKSQDAGKPPVPPQQRRLLRRNSIAVPPSAISHELPARHVRAIDEADGGGAPSAPPTLQAAPFEHSRLKRTNTAPAKQGPAPVAD